MKNRMITQTILIILMMVLIPVGQGYATTVHQQTPALILDGSTSPQSVQAGEVVRVDLFVLGDLAACDLTETRVPLDIVMVIDRSGSMDAELGGGFQGTKLDGAIAALEVFLERMDPTQDQVALVGFADKSSVYAPLGDRLSVQAKFGELRAGSGLALSNTNIEAGLTSAKSLLKDHRSEAAPVIVLLTDGLENMGDALSVLPSLQDEELRTIVIGLGDEIDEYFLVQLASEPADYYYAPETQSLQAIFESIANSVQTYSPASDIEVRFVYDVLNFNLIEESITPTPNNVAIDVITWRFGDLKELEKRLYVDLEARIPGVYESALSAEISYLSCGETTQKSQMKAVLPVTVEGGSPSDPVCAVSERSLGGLANLLCGFRYWPWLGALLILLALLTLWMIKNWDSFRAWHRCGILPSACMWIKLGMILWLALLSGALLGTLVNGACAPSHGYLFWRILPDRSSAVYVKPEQPSLGARPLTRVFPEQEWMGFYAASQANQRIVAVSRGTNGLLRAFDFKGNPVEFPQIQGSYPAWSPDGTKLAYSANNEDIYIYDLQTGSALPVTGASEPNIIETMPAWSADGSQLAFVRSTGSSVDDVITMPSDIMIVPAGGGVPQLVPGASGQGFNYYPAFSPDGRWLAFTHHITGRSASWVPEAEIRVIPAEGGSPRRIQANFGPGGQELSESGNIWPTWSQDSQTLFFSSRRCFDQYDIYSATIDETGVSSPALRRDDLSVVDSYEYKVTEVQFARIPLLRSLLNLWPYLLPLPLLLLLLFLFCRSKPEEKKEDTIQTGISVDPSTGFNMPNQKFEVKLEVYGKPICEKKVLHKPTDAILLIDNSYSMAEKDLGGQSRLNAAKNAAIKFVRCVLSGKERIAVVSFSDQAKVHIGFVDNEKELISAINEIELEGSTNMTDGFDQANQLFTNNVRQNTVKSVILLSDGMPNDFDSAIDEAVKLHNDDVRILAVGVGDASEELLRSVTGADGDYKYVRNRQGLVETFIDFGKILISPIPAKDVLIKHTINAEEFELLPESIIPQPAEMTAKWLVWQVDDLSEVPKYFSYQVSPLNSGESFIDVQTEITYSRCESNSPRSMLVQPGAKVVIKALDYPSITKKRTLPEEFNVIRPDTIWQPDQALFVGIGHYGRKLLTYVRKNLLDAGVGNLPEGCEFLVFDTGGYDILEGLGNPVAFAGVEISDDDVFMIDENLSKHIDTWSTDLSAMPDYLRHWYKPRLWQGTGQEMNLATGRYSHRALTRVALLRHIFGEKDIASQWLSEDPEKRKRLDIKGWIRERCKKAKNSDGDLRIFLVGTVADGMSGTLIDLAILTREVAKDVIDEQNNVHIEAYLLDGDTVSGTVDDPTVRSLYLANTYATHREIDRWQMGLGQANYVPWLDTGIVRSPFDELFIYAKGNERDIFVEAFPVVSDVITTRLDRATGAGTAGDWFTDMHEMRTNRRQEIHQNVIGLANAFCMRVPVFDILKEINARWAYELVRLFLSGDSDKDIIFDLGLAGDPGFPASPTVLVPKFLIGHQGFGGDAPVESLSLAKAMGINVTLDEIEFDSSIDALPENEIKQRFQERLIQVVSHILQGTTDYTSGSRAGKLAYMIEFLEELERKFGMVLGNEPDSLHERVATLYTSVVNLFIAEGKNLQAALHETRPSEPMGLIQKLKDTSSSYQDTQDELNRISSRLYFWGEGEQDSYADNWYAQYLQETHRNYQDLIGWVIDDSGIDLRLRIKGDSVLLRRDGIEPFIEKLSDFALGLSRDAWQNVSLDKILSSRNLLQDSSFGKQIRRKIDYNTNQLLSTADPGLNPGKLLMLANQNILERFEGYEFLNGLRTMPSLSQIDFGDITMISSTDRYAISYLRLMDAVRPDRLRSVNNSKEHYINHDSASVFTQEVHAKDIETFDEFPDGANISLLHPILVVGLSDRSLVESFCLALAEGFIQKLPNNKIKLSGTGDGEPAPVILSEHELLRIDLTVNALINWVKDASEKYPTWKTFLTQRYQSIPQSARDSLREWVNWPNNNKASWVNADNLENESLRILVTVYTRHLLKNRTRKW
jgi:Mg-chelatase subunit ChlD